MKQTHDAETVERVAPLPIEECIEMIDELYDSDLASRARAALSALPPQQVSVADAAKVADEHADRYAMKAAIYRGGSNLCAHYTTLSKVSRSIADDIRALTGEDQ